MPDPVIPTTEPLPFWKRQFAPEVSAGQIAFDVGAGILLPLACLVLDPFVFRPSGPLAQHATVAYVTIALAFLSLAVWLLLRRPHFFLAGALAGAAAFSFLLGFILLPYSVLGLLAIIGVFGFAPFVTSFVYWRNSARAWSLGRTRRDAARVEGLTGRLVAGAGFVLVLALPLATQTFVCREIARAADAALSSGDLATSLATLKRIRWLVDTDSFVWTYEKEKTPERRQRLAELYWLLTGHQIEERLAKLNRD